MTVRIYKYHIGSDDTLEDIIDGMQPAIECINHRDNIEAAILEQYDHPDATIDGPHWENGLTEYNVLLNGQWDEIMWIIP